MPTRPQRYTGRDCDRRGPPRGGSDLRKLVDLSQDRAPSHPDAAEVRPCHPDQAAQMELAERHLCVQERCLKLIAVKHEVVRQEELLRRRCRSLRERWTEAWRCTPRCNPREPCSRLVLAQRLKARNTHSGPEKACMTCTAEDINGGGSVPTVPVNQIVSRGLGEAVKGAIHRVHAICTTYSRWRRLERRVSRHE